MGKKWYMSKAVQGGLAIAVIGILESLGISVPFIEALYSIAAGYGIIGLRAAKEKLE